MLRIGDEELWSADVNIFLIGVRGLGLSLYLALLRISKCFSEINVFPNLLRYFMDQANWFFLGGSTLRVAAYQ